MSTTPVVLREEEVSRLLDLDEEGLEVIAEGFRQLAAGAATMPPIMRVDVPEANGELDVKSAHVKGWDSFAVKLSSGFFDNPSRGLPAGSGMMILLSAKTGVPLAVFLDNGYLTRVRTALAGAVAARALAPEQVSTVGVLGAGDQARWQLRALRLVRDFERVVVWARRREAAEAYAQEMKELLSVRVDVVPEPELAVREAELVVTTTPATEPVLQAAWLHPGLHVTAMGSDAEHKQELEPAVLDAADLVVCDSRPQSQRLGELRGALGAGAAIDPQTVAELGEVLAGTRPARTDPAQISVCDLTGTGVQDTAIARLAYRRARG